MRLLSCYLVASVFLAASVALAAGLELIPQPVKVDLLPGQFELPAKAYSAPEEAIKLTPAAGFGDEGYALEIGPQGAVVRSSQPAGAYYGRQTALQLLSSNRLPCLRIEDAPRFAWRGFMLDESRHFFGKAVVKQLLDAMARLKLNRFHWHLTDEPGWRIEIKRYPRLTEVGAVGNWSNPKAPRAFYTQADIREIVAYAAERQIVVVPEIDMPGHATAATRAYPEFSGGGTNQWKGFTFNPASEATYRFLEDVLTEVAALFPGPYLHVGGDEVSYGNQSWKTDPAMQQFIRENDLKDALGLERYFVRRVAGIVHKLGKTTVGWDEIVDAGVPPQQSVGMWWRHDKPQVLSRALAGGYPVVLCPRRPCYFDFVQDDAHKHGRRWNGFNNLESVYAFPASVENEISARPAQVLGMEACLWTERVADVRRLGFMTFPRLAAIAEDAWTPTAAKSWDGFQSRVPAFLRWLDGRGVSYFDPFAPTKTPEPAGPEKKGDPLADG